MRTLPLLSLLALFACRPPAATPIRIPPATLLPDGGTSTPSSEWTWDLPPGFPIPKIPHDNPMSIEKVELGKLLFFDRRLSSNGTQSCADCHSPEQAFTDGKSKPEGSRGDRLPRSSMSLLNTVYFRSHGWATPENRTLEQQMRRPLFSESPIEMGFGLAKDAILQRLREDPEISQKFFRAFPDNPAPIDTGNLIRAIACYERTLISAGSAYDRLVYLDEADALSPSARRGMELFFSERTHCAECHAGFAFAGPVDFAGGRTGKESLHNTGVGPETTRFRIPSLRSIALTAPYMHDGSLPTLTSVIEHYAAGGVPNTNRDRRISGFEISEKEIKDLTSFLEALTDDSRN